MRFDQRVRRSLGLLCLPLLFILFGPTSVLAQGKIAGEVTDARTGEALIGVNVVIDGTTQGTTTNTNGEYVIVNVRPGEYTLVFSYIGFETRRVEGVRVSTGQTTRENVRLSEEVFEGQEIVVRAERPLVQKDLTASKRTVDAAEIDALPVEGFQGVLATQAGVTQGAGGEFHIRGGRSNEIAYLVDGMSVGNPFNTNSLATEVAADAIQEMTVISGAFNAEYGKAMSGIVNLVTKEGGDTYEGSLSVYGGDRVTAHGDIFMAPSNLDLNVYTLEGSLSGPIPLLRDLKFFVSARRDVDNGYIYGARQHLPSDSANFNPDPDRIQTIRQHIPGYEGPAWYYEFHGTPWYEYDDPSEIPGERVAMNPRETHNVLGKLTYRPLQGVKLELSHLQDGLVRTPFDFSYRFNPDGVSQIRDRSWNTSFHLTHTLNDRTYYTARVSYAVNHFRDYLAPVSLDHCGNIAETACVVDDGPWVVDRGGTGNGNVLGFPGNHFLFAGNQKSQIYEEARSARAKLDFTRQFGMIHEVRAGIDAQIHDLNRQNFVVLYEGNQYRRPTVEPVSNPSHDRYVGQMVTEMSAYVQDKLEFQDFIVNAGVRFERFDPNGRYIPNLLDPTGEREQATSKNMLLPRLGVSFPVTERSIIHFSYGHFAQMPRLRNMYLNPEFEFPKGQVPTFGNTNMRPERTAQYEIGFQQQVADLLAFDVTGYFKDIRDYLTQQQVRYSTIAGEDRYNIYINKNYANVKGVSLSMTKRRAQNGVLSATASYTYQVAEGNREDSDAFFFNFLSGRENQLEVVALDFDQRHVVNTTVTLSRPGNWGLSFIGQFATGYPYTPLLLDQTLDILPNSDRKPSQLKLDAHLYKEINVRGMRTRAFAKVFNVLDRLNERFVFDETGRATYSLSEQLSRHATWEPAYSLPGISTLDVYDTRPHWYSAPREVRVGLTLGF